MGETSTERRTLSCRQFTQHVVWNKTRIYLTRENFSNELQGIANIVGVEEPLTMVVSQAWKQKQKHFKARAWSTGKASAQLK